MPTIFFLLCLLTIYVAYHLTLLPSVPGGDSGELLAEACLLGTPHPPGYPLFSLLAHLQQYISFVPRITWSPSTASASGHVEIDISPTFAWKVNHVCALLGSFTALFIYLSSQVVLQQLSLVIMPTFTKQAKAAPEAMSKIATKVAAEAANSPCACLGAFFFALSPLVWEYSLTAEVFALNNFLCSLLVYLSCRVFVFECSTEKQESTGNTGKTERDASQQQPTTMCLLALVLTGAFVSGLALANQHTSLLLLIVLIPAVLVRAYLPLLRASLLLPTLVGSALCFLLGLSPYAYLYVSSLHPKPGSWGDLSSLQGLVRHVMRAEYGTFQLGVSRDEASEGFLERVSIYLQFSSKEAIHAMYPLALVAIAIAVGCKSSAAASPSTSRAAAAAATTTNTKQSNASALALVSLLFSSWLFYTLVWHGVLSNLPLSHPMPFAVHARFWMQPNILISVLAGAGAGAFIQLLCLFLPLPEHVQVVIASSILAALLASRYELMDRHTTGWLMHKYADAALSSLPSGSLLLSHTDLDWNPIRYLRHCEHRRENHTDTTHLSFQLMPYPWFDKQQRPLYPHVTFPHLGFPGVSTSRASEGNAILVRSVIGANIGSPSFPGGVFVDMQAIHETEIGDGGAWRGLTLQPWGTLYRIAIGGGAKKRSAHQSHQQQQQQLQQLKLLETASLHAASLEQLDVLKRSFPVVNDALLKQFPAGTWEFAAMSVYYDAHYQLGLQMLTFAMSLRNIPEAKADLTSFLPILVDRMHASAKLLLETHEAVSRHGTISSSPIDVHKNAALAWMNVEGHLGVAVQFKEKMLESFKALDASAAARQLLDKHLFKNIVTSKGLLKVQVKTLHVLQGFVKTHPDDKDVRVFESVIKKLLNK